MRHLSASILLLELIISTSYAYVPRAKITAVPIAPRDGSYGFGTELITADISGRTTTFTHTQMASMTTNDAGDQTWSVQAPLASAMSSIYHDKSICSGAPGQKRDISDEQDLQDDKGEDRGLQKRVDPPLYNPDQLRPDLCFEARMQYILDNLGAGGPLDGAIALVQNGVPPFERVIDDINNYYEQLYPYIWAALDNPDLTWVPGDNLRFTVDFLAEYNFLLGLGASTIVVQWAWDKRLLHQTKRTNPPRTCAGPQDGALGPLCDDPDCLGGQSTDFKCKLDNGWKNCQCLNEYVANPDYAASDDWWTNYTQILDDYFPSSGSTDTPVCYGLNYPKFTTQKTAAQAVAQFCGTTAYLTGSKNQTHSEIFNNPAFSTPPDNSIEIGLYYPPDQSSDTVTISSDDCSRFLLDIVNGCDVPSQQNPGNIKHGGALFMPNGVTAYINPQGSYFATSCYGTGNPSSWDSQKFLVDSANDFCSEMQGSSFFSQRIYTESDGKTPIIDKASFTVTFDPKAKPTINDCRHILIDIIINGCDPGDNAWKKGGSYTTTDSVWTVTPVAARKPPDELTYGDNADRANLNTYGTTGIGGLPLDMGVSQQCLDQMKGQGSTDHFVCGNLRFFLDGQSWNSASDCHIGCVNDLSKAINAGANNAICRRQVSGTVAKCQEGFINSN